MFGNRRGMTLVEVVVAIFILALCILPVFTGLLAGKRNVEVAGERAEALGLAQGIMEDVLHQDFDDIVDLLLIDGQLTGVDCSYSYSEALKQLSGNNENILPAGADCRYSYTVSVTRDADNPQNLKIIRVAVYYNKPGAGGGPGVVVITSSRARR